jgi:hypothetical protein
MTRAVRPPRLLAARVVALVLAVGVSVSACTDAPAAGPAPSEHGADHAAGSVATSPSPGASGEHEHGEGEPTPATTGPARPADAALDCGTTVLPNGEQVTRYCNEGQATFIVGDGKGTDGKGTDVKGATCEERGLIFLAHFGANYSDEATGRGEYLGLALEDMPAKEGRASIYALELTLGGYRQSLSKATVDVTRKGDVADFHVVGTLADGRNVSVTATCHTHEA